MNAKTLKRAACAGAVLLSGTVAQAADVRPFVRAGIDGGGDTLVTVVFVGGDTESIKANEGVYGAGGVSIRSDGSDLEVELSLGYKFDRVSASNGNVDWEMWPLDALVFYRFPKFRLGGGLTYHINPRLNGSGVAGGLNLDFDNAFGVVLQGEYLITPNMAVGARYTDVKYEVKGGGASAKSGGLGAVFTYRF
jgi:Outer membrane protein beta-barrel domain